MIEKELELRMYCMVAYNLSPIQKGIQALHAVARYASHFGHIQLFKDWVDNYETVILLDAGTSNSAKVSITEDIVEYKGSLNQLWHEFSSKPEWFGNNLDLFHEPDYNDGMTAFCLIVDERVFNKRLYPDYNDFIKNYSEGYLAEFGAVVRQEWLDYIGGEKIAFMKEKLNRLPLAR
jgi:hypothetical protein